MIEHVVPHSLTPEALKQVATQALDWYQKRYAGYQPTLQWISAERAFLSLTARGVNLSGEITLREEEIHIALDVPFVLRVFRKQAIERINQEAQRWLAVAQTPLVTT